MRRKYGIILLDRNEIVIRIYESDAAEWKLANFEIKKITTSEKNRENEATFLLEKLNECFLDEYSRHIATWKICARFVPQPIVHTIAAATGLTIENLTNLREQELLCKGMFTELW